MNRRRIVLGMLLAIAYFASALVTCFPQFPAVALSRFGAVLHLLVMPVAVMGTSGN